MTAPTKTWVVGPSGSGKSWLIEQLRTQHKGQFTVFDLDFLGYRKPGEGFMDWHINPEAFKLLSDNTRWAEKPLVAVGSDSSPQLMRAAAISAGFETLMVIPPLSVLQMNGRNRGDKPEKVAAAEFHRANWLKWAQRWELRPFNHIEEVLSHLRPKG